MTKTGSLSCYIPKIAGANAVGSAPTAPKRTCTRIQSAMALKGISQTDVAKRANASTCDVSHFVHERFDKIGYYHRKRIESTLTELGCYKPRGPLIVLDTPRFANIRFDREAA